MIRILGRLAGRLVRLAAWFALGWAAAALGARIRRRVDVGAVIERIVDLVAGDDPDPRYYVGPDDPHRPGLGRAMAAAVDLAEQSPGPSPSIRLRIPKPDAVDSRAVAAGGPGPASRSPNAGGDELAEVHDGNDDRRPAPAGR